MGIVLPKYDFVFKALMENEKVRWYFISDILGIPLEQIRSLRMSNPFLWKRRSRHKLGILDVLLVLNDNRKINIELQVKVVKYWDKRAIFYISKMFTEDLLAGEDYTRLKKCIGISILDFNVDECPKYHRIYRLRDEDGHELSDLLEIHIVELKKRLEGDKQLDDWIRLFNARTEEDLDMIKTENPGILEAIREIKVMSLGKSLRWLYEARLKEIRDLKARDDYVRDEGIEIGRTEGRAEGRIYTIIAQVRRKCGKGISVEDIVDMLDEDEPLVRKIYGLMKDHPKWNDDKIFRQLKK